MMKMINDINYFITDHLGSTRVITDNTGSMKEQNDYYPFGMRHSNANLMLSANRWGFNGKEKQTIGNINYMDYGARMYDDFTGRWFVQDPLQEKYYPVSAYAYCINNPLLFVDPDGRSVWGFLKGLGKGVLNSVKNTWNFVTSDAWKSSTWKGIGNLALGAALSVGNPNSTQALIAADNTLGTNTYEAVSNTKESIKNTVEKIASGNSEAIGEAIGDIAISATLTKGVSSIASKAEKLSGAAATAGKAAEGGAKAIKAGEYTITKTVASKLSTRPYIDSPSTITNIIKSGKGVPDVSFKGGMNYKVSGSFNGSNGIWELGINPKTNTIYHFLFKSVK